MMLAAATSNPSLAEVFRSDRASRWYVAMAWLALAVAVVGFLPTFILPMARGTFRAPVIVYAHAALVLAWLVLFAVQATLVRGARIRAHRRAGALALGLAPSIVVTGIGVGVWAMQRDVAAGGGETAVSGLVGTVTSLLIFGLLVAAGVACRRRPDCHKRLLLLATLSLLWPAWFRFRHHFPAVPHPDIVFALVLPDLWILLSMLRDRLVVGRVHPVYLIAGLGLIAEQVAETIWFDTPGWRAVANRLADLLS